MTDRCGGCGTAAGQPKAIYQNARDPNGQWTRVVKYTVSVQLELVQFLDYGERWLCQFCREGLYQESVRLTAEHFVIQAARMPPRKSSLKKAAKQPRLGGNW